jgi:adenine-specific DNA-methyltransferase
MRYIGNKTALLSWLKECIQSVVSVGGGVEPINKFYDLFSGTGAVAEYFKSEFNVVGNDLLKSSSLVTAGRLVKQIPENIDALIEILNSQSHKGFITEKFSGNAIDATNDAHTGNRLFFSYENGQKIDGIMIKLNEMKGSNAISDDTYNYLIYIILDAVHKVSNTTGVYGAFLKKLSPNATKLLTIKPIPINKSDPMFSHECYNLDCVELLEMIQKNDIVYLDPPYNSRQYGSNYHVLETIVKYDNPVIKQVRGLESKTGLRNDLVSSKWCQKRQIFAELNKVIECPAKYIFLSYNNEGLISEVEIKNLLSNYGEVIIFKKEHKKYKSNQNNNKADVFELLFSLVKN